MRLAPATSLLAVAAALLVACVSALPGGSLGGSTDGAAPATGGSTGNVGGQAAGGSTGNVGGQGAGGSSRSTGAGGAGAAGLSALVPLVTDGGRPGNIAVDSANVYWVDRRPPLTLMKAPIAGDAPSQLSTVHAFAAWVAADAGRVYWSDGANGTATDILTFGPAGGAPTMLAAGADAINRITVGRGGVYWTTSGGAVMTVGLAGGTATMLAAGQISTGDIVADAANVYWIRVDKGSIMKIGVAGGGEPVTLASQVQPGSLAVDAGYVYYGSPGTLMRIPVEGGQPEGVFGPVPTPTSVAVDASGVYWIDANGTIFAGVPGQAMSPRAIATSGSSPNFSLVLDASSVYWIGGGTGSILRAPK